MRFAKGHGTGNDFLILPDPDGAIALPPGLVARLCDRRTGLGADGILRAVRVRAAGAAVPDGAAGPAGEAEWFMDYRNADGSVAEMCGNGVRVFARYLLEHGLADGPELALATRAGLRLVRAEPGGEFTVDMGAAVVGGRGTAVIGSIRCDGVAVSLGNPHLACVVDGPVAGFDLTAAPVVDHGQFPDGVNVEVVRLLGERRLEMRVHERGSGETLSCGTGAVAAAAAAATAAGPPNGNGHAHPADVWTVQVPGGALTVTLSPATSLLTGPAVIVAEGELDPAWLAAQTVATTAAAHHS
jgi:diaminopimelate epimerase